MPGANRVVHLDVSDRRAIVGLTSFDNRRLFVLRSPSKRQIEVYDTTAFVLQQTLKVAGLSDGEMNGVNALTSCVTNNCLYVSDFERRTVYKLELAGDSQILNWRVGRGPTGLSINTVRNLLVTCHLAKQIQEYAPNGSLVRAISLRKSPWHTIQLAENQFVVGLTVAAWLYDVCEIDAEGHVVISYTSLLQSTSSYANLTQSTAENKFHMPRHLAAYRNECTFIADCDNNRIVMFDYSLQRITMLNQSVDGSNLNKPHCLCVDESANLLYVGEGVESGRIFLYDISRQQ
jgi:hypothetical protein